MLFLKRALLGGVLLVLTPSVLLAQTAPTELGIGTGDDELQATLHIRDQGSSEPAILISGASSTEGDIAVLNNDTMQFGNWRTDGAEPVYVVRLHMQ